MARKETIRRSITSTTIHGYSVKCDENGTPNLVNLEPVTVCGKIAEDKAVNVLKGFYNVAGLGVAKVEHKTEAYEIAVDDFMKHAKLVTDKTEN